VKYGRASEVLNDPEIGISKKDLDTIKEEKVFLPEPNKQLKGDEHSWKADGFGRLVVKTTKKLRKYNFVKLREKLVSVKKDDIKKVNDKMDLLR
jgi:hypothetical protein